MWSAGIASTRRWTQTLSSVQVPSPRVWLEGEMQNTSIWLQTFSAHCSKGRGQSAKVLETWSLILETNIDIDFDGLWAISELQRIFTCTIPLRWTDQCYYSQIRDKEIISHIWSRASSPKTSLLVDFCFSLSSSQSATTFTSLVLSLWCLINELFGFSSPQKAHLFTNTHMHVLTHMQTHNCILVTRALRDPLKTMDTGLRTLLQVMCVRPKGHNNHMQGMNHIS